MMTRNAPATLLKNNHDHALLSFAMPLTFLEYAKYTRNAGGRGPRW